MVDSAIIKHQEVPEELYACLSESLTVFAKVHFFDVDEYLEEATTDTSEYRFNADVTVKLVFLIKSFVGVLSSSFENALVDIVAPLAPAAQWRCQLNNLLLLWQQLGQGLRLSFDNWSGILSRCFRRYTFHFQCFVRLFSFRLFHWTVGFQEFLKRSEILCDKWLVQISKRSSPEEFCVNI